MLAGVVAELVQEGAHLAGVHEQALLGLHHGQAVVVCLDDFLDAD